MRTFGCCVLLMLLGPAVPAAGRDVFVSNVAGDDRSSGLQPRNVPDLTGPVRTIAKALRLAGTGDRIVLENTGRPYHESVALAGSRRSGDAYRLFMIEGNGAILDGSAPVPRDAWEPYRGPVFRFRPPQMGYQQLFIGDHPAVRVIASRLSDSPPKLQPREWCLQGGMVYYCVEPTKLPEDYHLSYAQLPTGITLHHVERVGISNLIVQGFQLDGINAVNSARRIYLSGLTCRGNGRAGIVAGGASVVDVDACLVGNNGQAQLLTLPWSETHVHQSRLLSNTAPAWVDQGGRVYLGDRRVEGGLEEIAPEADTQKAEGAEGKAEGQGHGT